MAQASDSDYRKKAIEEYGERCKLCESTRDIRVHHIDGDRENNSLDNLLVVCAKCHADIHSPQRVGLPHDRFTNHLPQSSIYGESNADTELKIRSISIREDQHEWINKQDINLSSFVRRKADELQRSRD